MTGFEIVSVRERPDLTDSAVAFFQRHWASEDSMAVYDDCIRSSLSSESPLPQWYVMLKDGKIVAGAGLIANDFISRMDLWPWLAALYVEEEFRGRGLGGEILRHARAHAARLGFDHVYLATDHIGYYEKYGFGYLADGYHPWGESSRIYRAETLRT